MSARSYWSDTKAFESVGATSFFNLFRLFHRDDVVLGEIINRKRPKIQSSCTTGDIQPMKGDTDAKSPYTIAAKRSKMDIRNYGNDRHDLLRYQLDRIHPSKFLRNKEKAALNLQK